MKFADILIVNTHAHIITATGISVNVHFQTLPLLTVFRERGYIISDYPVANDSYSREISLPIYPKLDTPKIDYIVNAVVNAYHLIHWQLI